MFSYTPLQAVTTVENLDTNIRAKGLAAGGFLSGCMGFINQFAGPIALANIGYNVSPPGMINADPGSTCLSLPDGTLLRPSCGTSSASRPKDEPSKS